MTPVQYYFVANMNKVAKKKFKPVMKKSWKYENEVIKCQTMLSHVPIEYGDRFIPRRYSRYRNGANQHLPNKTNKSFNLDKNEDNVDLFHLKTSSGYWRIYSHGYNTRRSLDLDHAEKVLHMHDWLTKSMCQRSLNNMPYVHDVMMPQRNAGGLDWPCRPRPVPLAYNDSYVL